ncbi:transcriptional regulator GlxA family with amidase domain [Rahnella inusitata]|nr:transcriptional regulator GlxA family with amidase domain [Rahnella inusitata]
MFIKNVYFVIFPNVNIQDFCGPLQVFNTANEIKRMKGEQVPYQLKVVSVEPGLVQTTSGLPIMAEPLPDHELATDTIVVAGGWGVHTIAISEKLSVWLKNHDEQSRRIASICSGAFLLAELGLLDGRRAVTHWRLCNDLAKQYPNIIVENNPIYVKDAHIYTSAGVTAGIDLALGLISDDLGHKLALEVARDMVVFIKRPGGQAQFSSFLTYQHKSKLFSDLHAWMMDNLNADLSVNSLAEFSCMSERSFVRHYKKETGTTPSKAVGIMRLEVARNLLIETELPLKSIAERCGFGSETTLRRCFVKYFGNPPTEYRNYFT